MVWKVKDVLLRPLIFLLEKSTRGARKRRDVPGLHTGRWCFTGLGNRSLLIVDEAHNVTPNTQRYDFVKALITAKSNCLNIIFLSATYPFARIQIKKFHKTKSWKKF